MNTLVRRLGLGPTAALALIAVLCAPLTAMADTVMITGANSGIGLEFARQYAARAGR